MNRLFRPRRLVLLAASGVAGALAFPVAVSGHELLPSGALEPLAFVCLVPALVALRGLRARWAFAAGVLAGEVFFLGTFGWVAHALRLFSALPWAAAAGLVALLATWCALHWGVALGLVRYFSERNGWAMGATLAPVWMATELLRNYFCSGFPWANLGYSQARNLLLSQGAGVVGVYGLAALVALVNGALYEVLRSQVWKEGRVPTALLATAAGLLAAGHVYGAWRVRAWDETLAHAAHLEVAVVQGNLDPRLKLEGAALRGAILDAYNAGTAAADDAGADLIVWPEGTLRDPLMPGHDASLRGLGLARQRYGARLLAGVDLGGAADGRLQNAAVLVGPKLDIQATYAKNRLVPFGEYIPWGLDDALPLRSFVPGRFSPGHSLEPLEVAARSGKAGAKVGVEICYDALFPELSRAYVRGGAELLVNMTNDAWYGASSAPFQFLRIAQLRAIETGRAVVRAANTGVSGFINPAGRIRQATGLGLVQSDEAEVDPGRRVPAEWKVASVPILDGQTPYIRVGDVPSYLAVLFCFGGVAWGIRKGRRTGPIPRGSRGIF